MLPISHVEYSSGPEPMCGRSSLVSMPNLCAVVWQGSFVTGLSTGTSRVPPPSRLAAGEGRKLTGAIRLDRGVLKVNMTSPQGEERILAIIGPGSIVGELAIIDGRPRSASVIAVRDCELSFITRAAFKEYTAQHADVYKYLVDGRTAWLHKQLCSRHRAFPGGVDMLHLSAALGTHQPYVRC
jgi:hypothetical protein